MTIFQGHVYRHKKTGKLFHINDIWIVDNPIEGCLSVKVSLGTYDDENMRYVVGMSQLELWRPFMEEVVNNGNPKDDPSTAGD